MVIKDMVNTRGKEISDAKDTLKTETKQAEDKLFKQSVQTVFHLEDVRKTISEIQNDISEIKDKLKTETLFLSPERKEQLTVEKQELENQLNELNFDFIKATKNIEKIEKKYPTLTKSDIYKKEEFIEILLDEWATKQLTTNLTRLYYLGQDKIPTDVMEQQLYLFLKSERTSGNAWVNDFNTEVLLLRLLKEMKIKEIIENYSYDSNNYLDETSEEFLAISYHWDTNILGDRPKNHIKQLRNVLDYVGYDIAPIYQDRKGMRKYIIVPCFLKDGIKNNNIKDLKEKLKSDYQAYKDFYEKVIESIGIKLSQKKAYRTFWEHLPAPKSNADVNTGVEFYLATHSDLYINKSDNACLINEQQASIEEVIAYYSKKADLILKVETILIHNINCERYSFTDNTSVTITESNAQRFWSEVPF